ncbi:MAG: hypothetical protein FJ000_01650 [Actinobacteria bacterium]|nr:hypothetical protein [Actinomycetota bacterium]
MRFLQSSPSRAPVASRPGAGTGATIRPPALFRRLAGWYPLRPVLFPAAFAISVGTDVDGRGG